MTIVNLVALFLRLHSNSYTVAVAATVPRQVLCRNSNREAI